MNINYDLSHLLGYLSLFITILFGLWGIYVTIKNRYFVQISFVLKKSIALFDTIVKNIPELSVTYNGSPINQNLILIEGALVNTGKKDILPSMIEKPICFNLPKDFKWITAKIISTSNNVEANIILNDTTLIINSGLLKLNEYIIFQALLEVPHNDNMVEIESKIHKIIKYSHRIADMPNIINQKLVNIDFKQVISTIVLLSIGIIVLAFLSYNIASRKPFMQDVYLFEKGNNEKVKVMISKIEDDNVIIKGVDSTYKLTLPFREFYDKRNKIGEIPESQFNDKIFLSGSAIIIIIMLIIMLALFREYKINKKLSKIFDFKQ